MIYRYYISYHYKDKEKEGFGSVTAELDKQIKSFEDIRELKKDICDINVDYKEDCIVIISFQLLLTMEGRL